MSKPFVQKPQARHENSLLQRRQNPDVLISLRIFYQSADIHVYNASTRPMSRKKEERSSTHGHTHHPSDTPRRQYSPSSAPSGPKNPFPSTTQLFRLPAPHPHILTVVVILSQTQLMLHSRSDCSLPPFLLPIDRPTSITKTVTSFSAIFSTFY